MDKFLEKPTRFHFVFVQYSFVFVQYLEKLVQFLAKAVQYLASVVQYDVHSRRDQENADGNYREHMKGDLIRIKKYFYILRPLLAIRWIEMDLAPFQWSLKSLLTGPLRHPN